MTFFILIDADNHVNGLYTDGVGYATPPVDSIAITNEQGELLRGGFAGYSLVNGELLYSKPLTPNPRIQDIQTELGVIDSKSIRAIRTNDTVRMAEYEAQAQALRDEMAALPALV